MTQLIRTVGELRARLREARRAAKSIGLVPTMGALHEGHRSLIRRSVDENALTAVSVFVNPTQFAPGEDIEKYPRPLADDLNACEDEGADVVFAPTPEEMYPEGFGTFVEVEGLGKVLCGRARPTHFRGVTTVCAKLFGMTGADRAYFGEKDYQQLVIIRRMVADLDMPVGIVGCPIIREESGLALSSRNAYLSEAERAEALVLHRSLLEAKRLAGEAGVTRAAELTRAMRDVIAKAPQAEIDYVEVVDPETLAPVDVLTAEARAMVAVRIGTTRLIDNLKITPKGAT